MVAEVLKYFWKIDCPPRLICVDDMLPGCRKLFIRKQSWAAQKVKKVQYWISET